MNDDYDNDNRRGGGGGGGGVNSELDGNQIS